MIRVLLVVIALLVPLTVEEAGVVNSNLEQRVVYAQSEFRTEPVVEMPEEDEEIEEPATTKKSICVSHLDYGCSCMRYLTQIKGLEIWGDAIDLEPNFWGDPQAGDVIIFHLSNGVAHASYIEAILPSGAYYISEWNYYEGEFSNRTIKSDSSDLYGFIRVDTTGEQASI